MAIVSKTNIKGVDVVVNYLQEYAYAYLISYWDNAAVYTSYPRVNKNYREDNTIPELSIDNKDYKEVLHNDKISVSSFFVVNDTAVYNSLEERVKQNISIIFQCDLDSIYGSSERLDEVFNSDVLSVFAKEDNYITGDITITTGVDNVYSDFTISGELKDKIKLFDMSSTHVVKLSFDVIFDDGCTNALYRVCQNVITNVNDDLFSDVPSGTVQNIPVVDQNGNPVVTTIVNGQVVVQCGSVETFDININTDLMREDLNAGDEVYINNDLMREL